MSNYYKGKVKVIGVDMMCFPADPITLESLSCGCYDPYAWSDHDTDALVNMDIGTWEAKRAAMRDEKYVAHYRERALNGVEL